MIRVLVFLVLAALAALGAAWIADRPGEIVMVWHNWRISTSITVADNSGNSDAIGLTQPSGQIRFTDTGNTRTFSVNGGPLITGNSGDLSLSGITSVTFNGKSATFSVVSSTEITATVPAAATTGPVKVVTSTGTLKSNISFRVTN